MIKFFPSLAALLLTSCAAVPHAPPLPRTTPLADDPVRRETERAAAQERERQDQERRFEKLERQRKTESESEERRSDEEFKRQMDSMTGRT